MKITLDLKNSKEGSVEYNIAYRLPLGSSTQVWSTEDFDTFVRKYINLTLSKITILSVTITGNNEDESRRNI